MKRGFFLLVVLTISRAAGAESRACALEEISFDVANASGSATSAVGLNGYRIAIEGYNSDAASPRWEGPISVEGGDGGSRCAVPEGIVMQVHRDDTAGVLAVQAYSGSEAHLRLYETASCKPLSSPLPHVWVIGPARLERTPFCAGGACWSGAVYELDGRCRARHLAKDSERLTRRILGTVIKGESVKVKPDSPILKHFEAYRQMEAVQHE